MHVVPLRQPAARPRPPLRARLVAGACALAAALTAVGACTAGPDRRTGSDGGAHGALRLRLSFGQLSSHVGAPQGLLRVVNDTAAPVQVTGVGLDWAGYGDRFVQAKDSTVPPRGTVDFVLDLPQPRCAGVAGAAVLGVVEVDGEVLRAELEESGRTLLTHKHELACEEQHVLRRVDVAYDDTWRIVGHGPGAAVLGHLRMDRRSGAKPVRLVGAEGSVLYDLELPGPSVLPAGAARVDVPVRVLPGNRCDEHAIGQATAPFAFRFRVRVDGRTLKLPLAPPPDVQAKITALLARACG